MGTHWVPITAIIEAITAQMACAAHVEECAPYFLLDVRISVFG